MTYIASPVADEDLHSFVDHEVDDEKREAVLAHLAAVPADAARVEAWRQQNILLRAAFAQVTLEPVPANLSFAFVPRLISLSSFVPSGGAARQVYAQRLQRRSLVFTLAAFLAGMCIALAATFSVNRYTANFASVTAASHGPALALTATAALHAPAASATLPRSVTDLPGAVEPMLAILPALKAQGLELRRGEIRGEPDDPANCLDFADQAGVPVVLCIAAAKPPANIDFQSLAVYSANAVYWHEAASLYALAAPYESRRLIALARQIHASLAAQREQQTP
jgi:anti-sigma factor RsiW